jgi:phosphohistidine phosphatase
MSQTLYLLRHAKAEPWQPGSDDFARRLNEKGAAHARALAQWMRESLPEPDAALCSSSARTRETLAPMLDVWPSLSDRSHYLDAIYEATTGRLHGIAEEGFGQVDRILMVGHNPGFESLVCALLGDRDAARIGKMPTGALAVIEFKNSYESDAGAGLLRHWLTRKNLFA